MKATYVGKGNSQAVVAKRVYYEGTSRIYEGMAVCYNYDTTSNLTGVDSGVTAEGSQNEGKYIRVEDPSTGTFKWFAGVVKAGSYCGTTGPCWLDIYVPNGAVIPVRTNANCSNTGTVLGISNGSNILQLSTGDSDPFPCAIAEETVDRSGTTGLVLAKLYDPAIAFLSTTFAPLRGASTGDAAGLRIYCDDLFTSSGATGPRTYGVYITGDRDAAYELTTAGCDDAALRISVNNHAGNEEIYNFRGLNVVASNREGGIVGELDNIISVSAKQGSTNAQIIGLKVDAQSLSADTADVMVGLDVAMNREGGVSTEEAALRLRTRGTINTAINAAIRIDKDATDHGFINLLNIEADAVDYAACTGDVTVTADDKVIPIVLGGTTYYLIAVDGIPGS